MPPTQIRTLVLALALCLPGQGLACSAKSGAGTTALVELYTSEGCDSCPPADRWLSSLGSRGLAPGKVVPIALHASLKKARLVYTPQVLLQGQDFRGWASADFEHEVARINARPAAASIALSLGARRKDALEVEAIAQVLEASQKADAVLYVASYENRLKSEVRAGENRGTTLAHDFVVFEWQGPLEFRGKKSLTERRTLPLLPRAVAANSGVAAFVQNRATGEVLQALMLGACPG